MDRSRTSRHRNSWLHQQATLAALVLAAAAPFALMASLVPPPLLLASMSLLALAAAALTGAFAWWIGAGRNGDRVTAWDLAAAFAFVGFCAAMLSEPANVLSPTAVAMN
jgi:hypothetical protein